ncbi:MAG: serine/threonine-protein kinase [Candidatus Eremiobacteraeota bacterium]|nr:serine/threonine-protein kinase [Candidatus Eremiobacteraeota bacterium]
MSGPLKEGETIKDRYKVERLIGEGATGFVYLVTEISNPAITWAVKEIVSSLPAGAEQSEILEQFQRECAILQNLNHTGLPKVGETFSEEERHYLVMEYIDGENLLLKLKIRESPFTFEELLPVISQLTSILEYLHGQDPPVIFRDLKPSNIMITAKGRVKLIDFGIARHFTPGKVRDTYIMGTPGFSAPEQYGKEQTDPKSDLYSLAVTVYFLLTKEDPEKFAFKFPPVTQFNSTVPQWLSAVLSRALEEDREKRFPSVGEMLKEIRKNVHSESKTAFSLPPQPQAPAPVSDTAILFWKLFSSVTLSGASVLVLRYDWGIPLGLIFAAGAFLFTLALFFDFFASHGKRGSAGQGIPPLIPLCAGIVCAIVLFYPLRSCYAKLTPPPRDVYGDCVRNLESIGVACELYAGDNGGLYPPALDKLAPRYIEKIPACSLTGQEGYYYQTDGGAAYTVQCKGRHKEEKAPYFPQYSSSKGLSRQN